MLKKLSLSCCFLLTSFATFSQSELPLWEEPLKSVGEVPEDFFRNFEERVAIENDNIRKSSARFESDSQEEYVEESEFYLNRFLASGDILYGDAVSQYCNEIVDLLLKDDPELRAKIRVYTVRTPSVNAAATNSGILLVNHGLIAEAENEAQLAAVLAHEIIHYRESHSVDQYLERERRSEAASGWFSDEDEEELENFNKYSQEHELEADTKGLEDYYLPAGYSHREAEYMMDILLYSYLPFDEIPYEKEWLERGPVSYPMEYYLEDLKPITAREDFDDSETSHPNIKKRKEAILERETAGNDGAKYLISEERFKNAQKIARFESARMYMEHKALASTLYQCFLLDKTYGPSAFSSYLRAVTLHQLADYVQFNVIDKAIPHYEKVEGQSQQIYFLLRHLSYEDIRSLAVAHSYEYIKQYPNDIKGKELFDLSMRALFEESYLQDDDFVREFEAEMREEKIDSVAEASRGRSSKIANIRTRRGTSNLLKDKEAAYHYNFVPYFGDSLFAESFSKAAKEYANEKEEDSDDNVKVTRIRVTTPSKYDKPVQAHGIDRVLFLTPVYAQTRKIDSDEEEVRYAKTERMRQDYHKELFKVARVAGLEYDFLDYGSLDKRDEEKFNDLMILRSYLYERIKQPKGVNYVSTVDLVKDVMAKYDTKYLVFTGNKTARMPYSLGIFTLYYSIFFPPSIPYAFGNLFVTDYESVAFMVVIDTETGELVFYDETEYSTKDSPDYLRSVLYNQLIQIKQEKS